MHNISQAMEGASASDSLLAVGRRAVEVWYVISSHSMHDGLIVIDFYQREPLQAGGLGKLKPLRIASKTSEQVADPIDCELLDLLIEVQPKQAVQHYSIFGEPTHRRTLTPACTSTCCPGWPRPDAWHLPSCPCPTWSI